ncbi:MAG: GNAT family N-acetyltransferase [Anaerolineae bacterium]
MQDYELRRYAGTLAEAQGILAVERQTFKECPYGSQELRQRLQRPEVRLWLAEANGRVIAFIAGLRTAGSRGPRLEADLLAVDPAWQRKGIGTALLRRLCSEADACSTVRGFVGVPNSASQGAFARAGFVPSHDTYDLLIYRIRGREPRPIPDWGGSVGPLSGFGEATGVAALAPDLPNAEALLHASQQPGTLLLSSQAAGAVTGMVEYLEVHTLLYSGLWLETVTAAPGRSRVLHALIAAGVEQAKARGLDQVSCMVPNSNWLLRATLLAEGFAPLDRYHAWILTPCSSQEARP